MHITTHTITTILLSKWLLIVFHNSKENQFGELQSFFPLSGYLGENKSAIVLRVLIFMGLCMRRVYPTKARRKQEKQCT